MLKTTSSPDVSRSEVGNGNGDVVGFGIGSSSEELAKKFEKLEGQKLTKSQKLSKSGKSKSEKSKKCHKVGIHLILTLWRPDQTF